QVILEGTGLRKHFPVTRGLMLPRATGWIKAVDQVDVTVQEGETVGLVGESGSGKTTLAKLFLLLERPTEGTLRFYGKDLTQFTREDFARYRQAVQAVFQDPWSSLNPRMRVRDIIAEPLPRGTPKSHARGRVTQVLSEVGLSPDSGERFPHEFSGGQRQRIAVARALVTYPKSIILDEPVSALDVSIRAQVLNLLKDIQQRLGLTYFVISHDLATMRYISNRLNVMYAGKIVETGQSQEVYSHPLHPYSQALLSAALPLHPSFRKSRIVLSGEVPSPLNPPSGCRFHPRCPLRMAICSEREPLLKEAAPGRLVACHAVNKPD
ncbi:MAG: ATP-binding cassette domain-containing protein, partial [Gemmataceae bacterium]|nr:ATP-binding cassette domain-containing protein [Gemmataceae bacterium]